MKIAHFKLRVRKRKMHGSLSYQLPTERREGPGAPLAHNGGLGPHGGAPSSLFSLLLGVYNSNCIGEGTRLNGWGMSMVTGIRSSHHSWEC